MSTTTNLSSLVINYLTQAQYDAASQAGTLNENQIYLTPAVEFVETDPTVPSWAKQSSKPSYALSELTGAADVQAIEGLTGTSGFLKKTAADTWTLDTSTYLTSFTETDPVFSASAAAGITSSDISNWNGKSSTDEKLITNTTTNNTNYYLVVGTDTSSATVKYIDATRLVYYPTSTQAMLRVGNSGSKGILRLGSANTNAHTTIETVATSQTLITLPDADGTVALTSDTFQSTTATLTTAGWSSKTQTVNVTGVTASNIVVVSPAPTSHVAYCEAGIYCSAQGSGTLTFTCDEVPESALTVNILYK